MRGRGKTKPAVGGAESASVCRLSLKGRWEAAEKLAVASVTPQPLAKGDTLAPQPPHALRQIHRRHRNRVYPPIPASAISPRAVGKPQAAVLKSGHTFCSKFIP